MNPKTEFTIFFAALVILGVVFAGGISYFKIQGNSDGLLADITATVPPQSPVVETIPTSTIVATISTSSQSISPLVLPYSFNASTSNEMYWPKAWSDVFFTNTSFALVPDPVHHGANTFLKGAEAWTNYAVSANASSLKGGWFDIISRVASGTQDFVYCEFGSNGTEVIERVNGADTQLAATSASTTDIVGATEKFGMKVYGHDIACMMADQEVVGAHVASKEPPAGGIGFVIFGQPNDQKQVEVSNISVMPLLNDAIVIPFPVPVVIAPSPTPVPTTPPPPAPTPAPEVTTTTKTFPYAAAAFDNSQGWNTYWGDFSVATDSLNMAASTDGTSAGVLLAGTNAWDNYTFTANLDWVKGKTFGLYARYTNAQNYVVCVFNEPDRGDIKITLEQHVNGTGYVLARGDVSGWNQWGGTGITAYIQVQDTQGMCSFNNSIVSSAGEGFTLNPPFSGQIGFMTSDPAKNNAQIIIRGVTVTQKY